MHSRFGAMEAPRLTRILDALDRGDLSEWGDFVKFAISTDAHLLSLHVTRTTRVAQAEYAIVPNEFGNRTQAVLAAEFVNEQLGRVLNWRDTIKNMANAVSSGHTFIEQSWERDGATRTNYIHECTFVPEHRFHYDEQWKPRIYDEGARTSLSSMYGQALDPRLWIVHQHMEQSGYPCIAGVFRSCAYDWLFRRWCDVMWLQYLEKFGTPWTWAEVVENTRSDVRQKYLDAMNAWSNTHAMVVEGGTKLHVESGGAQSGSADIHQRYYEVRERNLTKAYLGTSDAVDPAKQGSNDGAATRMGAVTDPRMVSDGLSIADSLHRSTFRWLLQLNTHKFGGHMPPVPTMAFKTATDEVKTDQQDLAEQNRADGRVTEISTPPEPNGGGPAELTATPKAQSRSLPRQMSMSLPRTTTTSRTTSPSARTLAKVLRGK